MNNRLTISTLVCPDWSIETIVRHCVTNGIAGIDFRGVGEALDHSLLPAFTTDADKTIAVLRDHGLSVPCMCSSVILMQPDEAKWKDAIEEYMRYMQLADRFGSNFVRIFPGRTPVTMTRDDAITMARRHARQLVKLVGDHRARPILETHDDWGASAEVVKLLAECSVTNFPVIWDVRHTWAARESPDAAVATLGERLAHVHVKDAVMIEGREEPALLGEGIVTVGEALKALVAAGYGGWICSETEKRWRPITAPEPEVSVPQFARFVRAI
jgi:sugar phosphate isomerase/epimerase